MVSSIMSEQKRTFIKINEAATRLGVTRRWIYQRIKEGVLPASKIGGFYFIAPEDLDEMIQTGMIQTDQPLRSTDQQPPQLEKPDHQIKKCYYCLRIISENDNSNHVCGSEGCNKQICQTCFENNERFCADHIPNKEDLLLKAERSLQNNEIQYLVKAKTARQRELHLFERIKNKVATIKAINNPITNHSFTPKWNQTLSETDQLSTIMQQLGIVALDEAWVAQNPNNLCYQYRLSETNNKSKDVLRINFQNVCDNLTYHRQGFTTDPLPFNSIQPFLQNFSQIAEREREFTIAVFISFTGWDKECVSKIQQQSDDTTYTKDWLWVYLFDHETRALLYDRSDPIKKGFGDLFSSILPDEDIEQICKQIKASFGMRDSIQVSELINALPFSSSAVRKALEEMVNTGYYTMVNLNEFGDVLSRR